MSARIGKKHEKEERALKQNVSRMENEVGGWWDSHYSRRLCGAAGFLWDHHHPYSYLVVDLLTVGKRISDSKRGKMEDHSDSCRTRCHLFTRLPWDCVLSWGMAIHCFLNDRDFYPQRGCTPPRWNQVWNRRREREKKFKSIKQSNQFKCLHPKISVNISLVTLESYTLIPVKLSLKKHFLNFFLIFYFFKMPL